MKVFKTQVVGGKNSEFHRQDMWNAIETGIYPEWELGVQIFDEDQQLASGFDILDDTKSIPEEVVPIAPLGRMTLNANPQNYFAETEQIGFQPGHIVRDIDFSDDPVLQGRLYFYIDAQLNRFGGPNFERAPVNRPRVPIHNNNRDGKAQAYIPTNIAAYSPNTLNFGSPMEATQTTGKGFFTAPASFWRTHL